MIRLLVASTALAAVLAATPALSAQEGSSTGEPHDSHRMCVQRLLDAINRERASHDLAPLRLDARMSEAASDRASDMFTQRYFAHYAPDGSAPFIWLDHRNYRYTNAGENLATRYRDADSVVEDWMGSPGHRSNILKPLFEDVGLAIVPGSPEPPSLGFTVVALFGREPQRTQPRRQPSATARLAADR